MPTEKQIEANRRNAQKSTGPRTDAGRAAVRLNGLTHGLTAETLVLPGEDKADFAALLASLEAEHRPATATETVIVRQMALASWRLRRVYYLEAAVFEVRLADLAESMDDDYDPELKDAERLAKVVLEDTGHTRSLEHLSRYESRLERSFYKALHELHRLRTQRQSEMTNQTQSASEPTADPAPLPPLQKIDHPPVPSPEEPAPIQCAPSQDLDILSTLGVNTNHADRHFARPRPNYDCDSN